MARRAEIGPEEVPILARQAVDEVAASDDLDVAADRALAQAPGRQVRRAILETSTAAPDPVTAAFVRAALRSGDPDMARLAADLLIDIRQGTVGLKALRECLASADAAVRLRAVEALESFTDAAVVPLLAAALEDAAESVRRGAVGAVALIVGTGSHPLREALLRELSDTQSALARAIISNEDGQVRRQAVQSLAFANSEAVVPLLKALSEDEDPGVRQEVVMSLAAVSGSAAAALMSDMLEDEAELVALSALDMLVGRLGGASTAFLEQLGKAMESPLVGVRRHAVLMMSQFEPARATPLLEGAAADPDFEVSRQARELLRAAHPGSAESWLAEEMARPSAGEMALAVWEAGDVALEAAGRGGNAIQAEGLVPALEKALRSGSASDRAHAAGELSGLVDMADSAALQEALNDADPAVRSRAADALPVTRDAALLVRVGRTHPDPIVRRFAVDALTRNPGGPKLAAGARRDLAFIATRTLGTELFGFFLTALRDPDDGVRQQSCAAIHEYAEALGLLPVRAATEALEGMMDDTHLSYLMGEEAARALGAVGKAAIPGLVARLAQAVLDARARVAREAHSVRWDEGAGCYAVTGALAPEVVQRWVEGFSLSAEQGAALRSGAAGPQKLDPEVARRVLSGMVGDLGGALDGVAHAAEALRIVDPTPHAELLAQWEAAVRAGPKLEWGPHPGVEKLRRGLYRLGRRAWVAVRRARGADLAEAAEDEDDWVKLTALAASAGPGQRPAALPGLMCALCEAHVGDADYREPIGAAGVCLLDCEAGDRTTWLESALAGPEVDVRMELTQRLMAALAKEQRAEQVADHLVGRPLDTLPSLCLALALRGAGRSLEGIAPPAEVPDGEWSEELCAALALRAMGNDPEATHRLEMMLREGRPQERYCGAHYLGLARVRSAALVFASVRDQEDAPYPLRALCGASLVRRGHPEAFAGLERLLRGAGGRREAVLLLHLCRAVEDAIPLMLECADVNVGRFV